jgi:hypothetical protein
MTTPHDPLIGPWISYETVPFLRREFDLNRDEYIRRQILDLELTEAQRRRKYAGKGEWDKAELDYKPPGARKNYENCWLKAERDAVMSRCRVSCNREERSYQRSPVHERSSR